jgi:Tfp pilus assembly protein PilF
LVSRTAPTSNFERAVQCHRSGNVVEAEVLCKRALAEDPTHHLSLHLLSTLALQAGRNEEAAALLERAIALAPEHAAYHSNLGEAYRRAGHLQHAADSLLRALAIRPDMAEATYNLGLVPGNRGLVTRGSPKDPTHLDRLFPRNVIKASR